MKPLIIITTICAAIIYGLASIQTNYAPVDSARANYQVKYDTTN